MDYKDWKSSCGPNVGRIAQNYTENVNLQQMLEKRSEIQGKNLAEFTRIEQKSEFKYLLMQR